MALDPFVAEVILFAGNFAPKGYALCNGQLLPISQNTALFSLLGTYYGGDGKSTFALPNLQGAVPIGMGYGQGLTQRELGQTGGSQYYTLIPSEIPAHIHTLPATEMRLPAGTGATTGTPVGNYHGVASSANLYGTPGNNTFMEVDTELYLDPTGSNLPLDNFQPTLGITFCIALQGVFPARP
ncbi:phage tail protein [Chitinophaga sp. CB10]|uniref:phage tail protein n=1 Tax=Chitinophaga sp. CB10 TaxID=1891659 RepID=UPI000A4B2F61|nr:tail fiber protein [Chitinophaga sp. CB10]